MSLGSFLSFILSWEDDVFRADVAVSDEIRIYHCKSQTQYFVPLNLLVLFSSRKSDRLGTIVLCI